MNPDNPYAAPQTIGQRPLAMAVGAETVRLAFPEYSTERLKQLLDYSRAIHQMHILWILLAVLAAGCSVIVIILAAEIQELSLAATLVLVALFLICFRVAAGYSREKPARVYAIFCDGLLIIGCMWSIGLLLPHGSLISSIILGFIAVHAASSLLAHHHARELFGRSSFRQENLALEVLYRQQNGIA